MKINIHFARIGKPEKVYVEDLVSDDGVRLTTYSVLPPDGRREWSKGDWKQYGIMTNGEVIHAVRKHHFYHEWFDVVELFGAAGELTGYYCDVVTPLRRVDGEYYLLDLLLDLWIFPDGRCVEMDWDEFEAAAQAGLISAEQQARAVETLRRMVSETQQGIFPTRWIGQAK